MIIALGVFVYLFIGVLTAGVLRLNLDGLERDDPLTGALVLIWPAAIAFALFIGVIYLLGAILSLVGKLVGWLCRTS